MYVQRRTTFRCAGECGWLCETRRICIWSRNKMAALGYVNTLGKQTSLSPERCTSQNATGARFIRGQIPPCVLVYNWDTRSAQIFGGRRKIGIWKGKIGVTVITTLFPHANSRSHLGTLSHFAPWNKPIHSLELFEFVTVSTILSTRTNTLDRSHHLEQGTFLNRCHYRDVW